MSKIIEPVYLGDGAYLKANEQEVIIYTTNGISITNQVYLEVEQVYRLIKHLTNWLGNRNNAP